MFRAVIREEGVLVTKDDHSEPETLDDGRGVIIAYDKTPELAVGRLKDAWQRRLNWARERVKEAEAELALIATYFDSKDSER